MKDQLTKGHFKGLNIAFASAVTTQAVNEIVIRHDCDPIAAHILGRALTGTLLSAGVLPEGQRMNACWKYKGSLKTVVVDAGQDGTVRAFISPPRIGEPEDMTALYGDLGDIQTVISHEGKVLNSGSTPVSLQDVAADLAYYHCISDQVETGFSALIGFNADPENPIKTSHGWMLQALPDCNLEQFDRIRRRLDTPAFHELLNQNANLEETVAFLTKNEDGFEGVYSETCNPPLFTCPCSKEKMSAVIRTIPIPERMEIVKEGKSLGIECQFCNERYEMTIEECSEAWNKKD